MRVWSKKGFIGLFSCGLTHGSQMRMYRTSLGQVLGVYAPNSAQQDFGCGVHKLLWQAGARPKSGWSAIACSHYIEDRRLALQLVRRNDS